MLNNRYFPLIICTITFVVWCFLLFYKYTHLGYHDWDLAFFTQACWQLIHGSQFVSVVGINYFGDHSYFITLLTLPFFALAPHPLTLVLLKLIAFVVAAYLLYRIAARALGQSSALVVMILYIIFPANVFSLLYEFNPESLAPPFLFWMFIAFERKQWKSFFWAAIFLMLIKENMALIVCAYGIYGLVRRHCTPRVGYFSLLVGMLVFCVLVFYVIPYFRELKYHAFIVRYAYLFQEPQLALKVIFDGSFIHDLFGPLLVPALFSWQILFLSLPILLQHLLSNSAQEHSIYYHYGMTLAPFIFLALIRTLKICQQKFSPMIFRSLMALLVLPSSMFIASFSEPFAYRLNFHQDHLQEVRWSFIESIPKEEGVVSTFAFLAPLSLRSSLYSFHKIYDEAYQNLPEITRSELNTGKSFTLPDHVRYALIDFKDPWLIESTAYWPKASQRIKDFLNNGQWKEIKSYGSIVLFKR